jgi:two-component system, LytTR family, response regulator
MNASGRHGKHPITVISSSIMHAINVFILEDDLVMRTLLQDLVRRTPNLELIGMSGDPLEAGVLMAREPVDILLLDIGLPKIDGFAFLGTLATQPQVIVISSDAHSAAQAFDHSVVDFLHKPFTYQRFMLAIERATRGSKASGRTPASPGMVPLAPARTLTITVRLDGRSLELAIADIEMLQSVGNYVKVHMRNGGAILIHQTMNHMEEILPGTDFVRIHRSYMIALGSIQALGSRTVEWRGGALPIGARYKKHAVAAIEQSK